MATFMKSLFWSVTAGLTMFIFLPKAEARGKVGTPLMGRKQMMVHSNKMVGMLNGGTTTGNTKMRPTNGSTTTGNRMMAGMTNGGMMNGNMMGSMMNGNMMGMNGGMMTGNTMTGNMMGRMMNGGMMTGNTMTGNMMGRMMNGGMTTGNMGTPFFPNGFGGFGNQGFGFSGNGFAGNGFTGSGFGGFGTGVYGGGYGYGGYDPSAYFVPTDNSQQGNSPSSRRRSPKEEPPTLTPEQERERIHKQEMAWSRSDLPNNQTTSAIALNNLLTDLQKLQTQGIQGPKVQIDEAILPAINVVTGGTNGNIGVLKHDGRISWPAALSGSEFKAERQWIDSSIPKVIEEAINGEGVDLQGLTGALASMRGRLAAEITEVPAPEYIRAKRTLDQLDDAVKLLRQPDAGNYFNQTYAAKGQTVAQLVQYMTRNNLQFAPAVEGGEAAYLVLQRALAEYDLAANSRVVAKK
jgi:hypothetical protein